MAKELFIPVIKSDIWKIARVLDDVTDAVMKKAAHRAVNRVATSVRAEAARVLSKHYALPIGGNSSGGGGLTPPGTKSMLEITKAISAKGQGVDQVYATISASNKPISMIHFIRGKKEPAQQKGIPIRARKQLRASITRGKITVLRGAFIAKAKGSVQVYRKPKTDKVLHKQSVPSAYVVLSRPEIKNPIITFGQERFAIEYESNVRFYLSKIKEPASK